MDGAKLVTDTLDHRMVGKAFCMGRSTFENAYGPCRNENPDDSKNVVL